MLLTQGREVHEALMSKLTQEDEERERVVRAMVAGLGKMATKSRGRDKDWERRALEGDTIPEADGGVQAPGINREATNLGAGALVESLAAVPSSASFYLTQQSPQNSFG